MAEKFKHIANLLYIYVFLLILLHIFATAVFATPPKKQFNTAPLKNNGKKWRIGYLEGGNYGEYHRSIQSTIKGLIALGWIKETKLPEIKETTGLALWEFYSKHLKSDFIEFVPDGFYSAEWNREKREKVKNNMVLRLNEKKDIDLMIAMGTWAGIDLSKKNHQTPTIVIAVSDAVASGIIKSIHDSGNEFIHARVDPDRYERQIRIFQTIIGFKTLGMIFRDNIEGRSYSAVDKVKKVARERGFTVQTCFLGESSELAEEEKSLIQCFKKLSDEVDAIYVTSQKSVNVNTIPLIADIAKQKFIPTFSQAGQEEVRKGLLLSISQAGFKYVGNFYAQTIAKVLNGAKPGELNQIFEDPSKIIINLTTAEAIDFYPSMDVLSSADEIFREVQ